VVESDLKSLLLLEVPLQVNDKTREKNPSTVAQKAAEISVTKPGSIDGDVELFSV